MTKIASTLREKDPCEPCGWCRHQWKNHDGKTGCKVLGCVCVQKNRTLKTIFHTENGHWPKGHLRSFKRF